jgi:hypothetical protein
LDLPAPILATPGSFLTVASDGLPVFRAAYDTQEALSLDAGALIQVLEASESGRHKVQFYDPVEGSLIGWVGLGSATAPTVEPARLARCPTRPIVGLLIGLSDGERLLCYGTRPIVFPAALFAPIQTGEPKYSGEPQWLAKATDVGISETPGGETLAVHLPPDLAVPDPESWFFVRGSFDDARAATCRRAPIAPWTLPSTPADSELWCRQQLVVSEIQPTSEPPPEVPPPDVDGPGTQP